MITRDSRLIAALLMATALTLAVNAADKDEEVKGGSSATININASQSAVWNTLTNVTEFDDTIESTEDDGVVVKQRFTRLPFFGELAVSFKATTVPMERVNFRMVHSNILKACHGYWMLTPVAPNETTVEAHTLVETGLPIPQFLVNQFISGKLHKRLSKLKKLSEKVTSQ